MGIIVLGDNHEHVAILKVQMQGRRQFSRPTEETHNLAPLRQGHLSYLAAIEVTPLFDDDLVNYGTTCDGGAAWLQFEVKVEQGVVDRGHAEGLRDQISGNARNHKSKELLVIGCHFDNENDTGDGGHA